MGLFYCLILLKFTLLLKKLNNYLIGSRSLLTSLAVQNIPVFCIDNPNGHPSGIDPALAETISKINTDWLTRSHSMVESSDLFLTILWIHIEIFLLVIKFCSPSVGPLIFLIEVNLFTIITIVVFYKIFPCLALIFIINAVTMESVLGIVMFIVNKARFRKDDIILFLKYQQVS